MKTKKQLEALGWTIFTLPGGATRAIAPIGSGMLGEIGLSWPAVRRRINKKYEEERTRSGREKTYIVFTDEGRVAVQANNRTSATNKVIMAFPDREVNRAGTRISGVHIDYCACEKLIDN
jgi:hypothetical protein